MFAGSKPDASKPVPQFAPSSFMVYLVHGLVAGALDAQVDHGVGQGAAHVELQGEVVYTLEEEKVIHFLE